MIVLATWGTLQFRINFRINLSVCIKTSAEILIEIVLNLSSGIFKEQYNMIRALF